MLNASSIINDAYNYVASAPSPSELATYLIKSYEHDSVSDMKLIFARVKRYTECGEMVSDQVGMYERSLSAQDLSKARFVMLRVLEYTTKLRSYCESNLVLR